MPLRLRRICRILFAGIALYAGSIAALAWSGLHDRIEPADVALVLGNQVYPDGTLSPRLEGRLSETVRRYREGLFPLVIVSGGKGREGRDEAVAMRTYLLAQGLPADAIITDSAGVNTFSSARNTRTLLDQRGLHRVFVITQYFHVPRTRLALYRFGVREVSYAHAHYFEWKDFFSIQRELFAYVRYVFRSYDVTQ